MIKLNGKVIELQHFPDGTLLIKQELSGYSRCYTKIEWLFENNEEMVALMFLTNHLRNNFAGKIHLEMPYIPNARQDRVKSETDVFTLKYFAEFINNLRFDSVTVLDPHSSVSEALFNNICVKNPQEHIERAVLRIHDLQNDNSNLVAFYPDEGAMKRYSGLISIPYTFGIKKRDWETGKILGLDAAGSVEMIKGNDVIIIDDICSRGGTFYHSAKKLKELGANKIYLYVTHCEHTIFDGELLTGGLIEKVYTTNSIFNKEHEKIEVFNYDEYEPIDSY